MRIINLTFAIICGFFAVINTIGWLNGGDNYNLVAALINYPASFLNWMVWNEQREEEEEIY